MILLKKNMDYLHKFKKEVEIVLGTNTEKTHKMKSFADLGIPGKEKELMEHTLFKFLKKLSSKRKD